MNKISQIILFSVILCGYTNAKDPIRSAIGSYRNYTEIKGTIKDDRYSSPVGTFSCGVPKLLQPGAVIKDVSNDTGDGRVGMVSFSDDLGVLLRVDWTEVPKDMRSGTNAPSEKALLDHFAQYQLYTYRQVSPKASLVYQTNLVVASEQQLFIVAFLPGGSTLTLNGKRMDAHRASIIFKKGDWVYSLSTQDTGVLNTLPPTFEQDCEQLKDKLKKFRETFQFN